MKSGPTTAPANLIVKPTWLSPQAGDDLSSSSTFTADNGPRKPLGLESEESIRRAAEQITTPRPRKQRRSSPLRVSFNEEKNLYYENETQYKVDCLSMWYNSDDLQRFKENIVRTVKTLHCHEAKNPSSGSIGNMMETTYVCCFGHAQETQKIILPKQILAAIKNQYRHNDDYVLGLERLIVRRIGKDRQELRKCLMDIFKDLQKGDWPDKSILAENIAQVSAEATRGSRLFARHLGSAQVPYLLTRRPVVPSSPSI